MPLTDLELLLDERKASETTLRRSIGRYDYLQLPRAFRERLEFHARHLDIDTVTDYMSEKRLVRLHNHLVIAFGSRPDMMETWIKIVRPILPQLDVVLTLSDIGE